LVSNLLRLPPSLWVLLLTNGGLVVGSMWIFGLESFSALALMTVALAGSIAFILFVVADLDNPFWGSWQVGPEAFQRALGPAPKEESSVG
jgi:ABC-type sugar transport system substrate-binding protein